MSTAEILQSPQKLTSAQLRKIKKPIIEKRRRERINESLSQLKTLVLEALNKDENQYNKMEKADILEMTVKHLRCLQRQVAQIQESNEVTRCSDTAAKYKSGYRECADEVRRYLHSTGSVSRQVKNELTAHLNSRVCTQQNVSEEARVHPSSSDSLPDSSHPPLSAVTHVLETSEPSNLSSKTDVIYPVNSSQTMIFPGPVSPILTGHSFVPIVISPVTSQHTVISPVTPQQTVISPVTSRQTVISPVSSKQTVISPVTQQQTVVSPVTSRQAVISPVISPVTSRHTASSPVSPKQSVISPVTSQEITVSQLVKSQSCSPIAATVIPLYYASHSPTVKDASTGCVSSQSSLPVTDDRRVRSALQFKNEVKNLWTQCPEYTYDSSFSVSKIASYSPENVWRPW